MSYNIVKKQKFEENLKILRGGGGARLHRTSHN